MDETTAFYVNPDRRALRRGKPKVILVKGATMDLFGGKSITHIFVDEMISHCVRAVPQMIASREPPFWAESWRSQEHRKNSNNRSRRTKK